MEGRGGGLDGGRGVVARGAREARGCIPTRFKWG